MIRSLLTVAMLVILAGDALPGVCQTKPNAETFFRENIGLSEDQIAAIKSGKPVTKPLPPRIPDEVLLFGAVYIHAAPEAYFQYARNFDRLRQTPGFLALGVFTNPPQLSDLKGFTLDSKDIQDLKDCEPGKCEIQMPATSIEELHRLIDWSAPDMDDQVNQLLQKKVFNFLLAYQHEGNKALGVYNDKRDPTNVPEQFAYLLSYDNALPEHAPDFYHYLLDYPLGKPANYEETFYWAKVKFGLKPTLRVVHMVTMRGKPSDPIACAIAQKQLYSSHYFRTSLDLSVCVRSDEPNQAGFYLITAMGSEQGGLTGVKGSIVRKNAVSRAVAGLEKGLATIKNALESN